MPEPADDDSLLNAMIDDSLLKAMMAELTAQSLEAQREFEQGKAEIAVRIARTLYPDGVSIEDRADGLMTMERSELELMLRALEERAHSLNFPRRVTRREQTISIPRSVLGTALSQFPEESDEAYQARLSEILRPDPRRREVNWVPHESPSLWARLLDVKNWI